MDWEIVLAEVITAICGAIISVGIPFIISVISKKVNNDKVTMLLNNAGEIVKKCVIMIDQTYVDGLKAEGKFDKECQKAAFNMCKNNVLSLLNEEAKNAIIDTCGNLDSWLKTYIEATVRDHAV